MKYINIIFIVLLSLTSCKKDDFAKTIDLSKNWQFSPDEDNIGTSEKWFALGFDDSKWDSIDAGVRWEDQGYRDLDGYGWYRKTVDVPKNWKGKDIWIKFAAVNDAYVLFVNGIKISSYGTSQYSFAGIPSFTEVSENLKYGEPNQITVQVNDWALSGGLWRLPVIITTDKKETELFKPISETPFDLEKEGYELYWEDEFNETSLDTTKWRNRGSGIRRGGLWTSDAVALGDGMLTIRAYMENDTMKAGAVSTEGIKGFKYGYFECRAKLPKTKGPWSAFWIQSPKISKGEDPGEYGVEIDIFEYFRGQGNDFVSHNLHWAYGPNQKTSGPLISKVPGIDEGFHTFAVEWTPEKYAFFVDGLKYHEYKEGISHIEEAVVFSYETCQKEDIDISELPDEFVIDYVKVYQKKIVN